MPKKNPAINATKSALNEEVLALRKKCDNLTKTIHAALGFIESDCEAECMRALQRSGIPGCSVLGECPACKGEEGVPSGYEDLAASARSKAMVIAWFRQEAKANLDLRDTVARLHRENQNLAEELAKAKALDFTGLDLEGRARHIESLTNCLGAIRTARLAEYAMPDTVAKQLDSAAKTLLTALAEVSISKPAIAIAQYQERIATLEEELAVQKFLMEGVQALWHGDQQELGLLRATASKD